MSRWQSSRGFIRRHSRSTPDQKGKTESPTRETNQKETTSSAQREWRQSLPTCAKHNRHILWTADSQFIFTIGGFFPTVHNTVPSRDSTMTETTIFFNRCFALTAKKLASWEISIAKLYLFCNPQKPLHSCALKMADCRCSPTLALSSSLKIWLGDINGMCL